MDFATTQIQLLSMIAVVRFLIFFLFTSIGGIGTIVRSLFIPFGIPFDIGYGSSQVSGVFTRLTSTLILHKKGFLNIKSSLKFIPLAIIGGLISSYVLITINVIIIEVFLGGILIISGIQNRYKIIPTKKLFSHPLLETHKTSIGYMVFLCTEIIGQMTGTLGIIQNSVLKTYFNLSPLQATATIKFSGMIKSIVVACAMIARGKRNLSLVITMILAGSLGTFLGTHFIIKKGETFTTNLLAIFSLILGIYLLISVFFK